MVSFPNFYQKFTLFFLFTKNTLDMTRLLQDPEDPHSTTQMICQPPLGGLMSGGQKSDYSVESVFLRSNSNMGVLVISVRIKILRCSNSSCLTY